MNEIYFISATHIFIDENLYSTGKMSSRVLFCSSGNAEKRVQALKTQCLSNNETPERSPLTSV